MFYTHLWYNTSVYQCILIVYRLALQPSKAESSFTAVYFHCYWPAFRIWSHVHFLTCIYLCIKHVYNWYIASSTPANIFYSHCCGFFRSIISSSTDSKTGGTRAFIAHTWDAMRRIHYGLGGVHTTKRQKERISIRIE